MPAFNKRYGPLLAIAVLAVAACSEMPKPKAPAASRGAVAIFAGGCFWCVERDFEQLDGVIEAESGYTGGHMDSPSYRDVGSGISGHVEAVRVLYDPARVSYARLLDYYWQHIDPTVKDRQFCDSGREYRSVIFWQGEAERLAAEASLEALRRSGRFAEIHTEITPASTFWLAEDEHQDYYKKNPLRYSYYRFACGRDARLRTLWGGS